MSHPTPDRPRPRPAVTDDAAADVAAADVPAADRAVAADEPSRSDRRRAQRRHERRALLVGWGVGLLVALVGIGATVITVLLVGGSGTGADQRRGAPASSAPSLSGDGAQLAYPDRVTAFLAAAASDIAAVTSYDYRSLDDALSAGLDVTTGSYRSAYRAALTGALGRTARSEHVVQTFLVDRIGIGAMSADGTSAQVLVFGRESITDRSTAGTPRTQPVTLTATLVRDGARYLISRLDEGANAGLPAGSRDLALAAEAARREVVALLTYRRASFAADRARALAGAVDPLRSEIAGNAASLRAALTKGRYDLTGDVTAVAVESVQPTQVTLLMAASGLHVGDDGSRTTATDGRYEVTAVRVGGSWYVTTATPVATG